MSKNNTFSRVGFVLATAGSAVGLGNVIRFPFVMGENGGGAFFAVYMLSIIFMGASVMLSEMLIGYKGEAAATGSFEKLSTKGTKIWKGLGWGISSAANVIFSYYIILLAWIVGYVWLSATGSLPHTSKEAVDVFTAVRGDMVGTFVFGGAIFIASFYVVAKGITEGIEKLNLVLMPAILIIFIGMLLYSFTLSGFSEAVSFMFHVDFSKITMDVVISAVGMSFFTLSLGTGIVLAYSAALPKDVNLIKSIAYVVVLDTTIAVVSGLMIFSFLFTYGGDPSAGFGLVFITLSTVFANLGVWGHVLGVAFFVALLFAGITSSVSMVEPMMKSVHIRFNMSRQKAAIVLGIPTAILSTLVILSLGGYIVGGLLDKIDFTLSNILLPTGAMLTSIFVGWFMNKTDVIEGVNGKLGAFFNVWYVIVKYIAPVVLFLVLLSLVGVI
ncbi:Putative transmembrane transport protein [hydrothermal vent metagenome]|uniref:Putative transmembrane transport protein n=1 Tax=hydrothermal vent metagenome TaxID=652676 RepID=A0A1W1ECH2_9ZZZZ